MPSPFVFNVPSARYRRRSTGRFVAQSEILAARDEFADIKALEVDRLTRRINAGTITLNAWEQGMRDNLKDGHIAEYMLGKGGKNNMTQRDYGLLGRRLRDQYHYLRGFTNDLAEGRLTERQALARAQMYANSAVAMFEKGRTEAMGMPPLPQYPADGQTICLTNCRCHLDITTRDEQWDVFWVLGEAEHCEDCVRLSETWAPFVVPRVMRTVSA